MGLNVLAVDNSRDCRDIESCLFSNILEDHRLKMGLVTIDEVVMLIVHDGLHCA